MVYTDQHLELPYNVFGLLTGKGELIFRGIFISAGKIDPGYRNRLRIGVFNGGPDPIVLKNGVVFCSCCFFGMESHLEAPPLDRTPAPAPGAPTIRFPSRARKFILKNWFNVLSALAAIIAIIISILK